MVTPFRFRAVTSRPRGKCRSIFLTGGVVSIFLSASLSSRVVGEVLSFLCKVVQREVSKWWSLMGAPSVSSGMLGGIRVKSGSALTN